MVSPLLQPFRDISAKLSLQPLTEEKELEELKVEYAPDVLAELQQLIEDNSSKDNKILVTGHRGCGKSTLLVELSRNLQNNYFVVFFSIADAIGTSNIDHIDLLFFITHNLIQTAHKQNLNIDKKLPDSFYQWFAKRTKINEEQYKAEVAAGFNLFTLLEGKFKADSGIRYEIKQEFRNYFSELIERIELINHAIFEIAKKPVLVIIDDLDKLDLHLINDIFHENIKSLFEPSFTIVFTLPISAFRDITLKGTLITETNNQIVLMPVSKLFTKDTIHQFNAPPEKQEFLRLQNILEKRINPDLIETETLDKIIVYSGGVLRELIRISNECCNLCLRLVRSNPDRTDIKINDDILTQAIKNIRLNYFEAGLGKTDYDILTTTYHKFEPEDPNNESFLKKLLHSLYVLEYRNDDIWYDVHPIVIEILRRRELI